MARRIDDDDLRVRRMSGPTHVGRSFTLFREPPQALRCRRRKRHPWRSGARYASESTSAARSPTSCRRSWSGRARHAQGAEHSAGTATRRHRRAAALLRALRRLRRRSSSSAHSTTIATNALLGQIGLELPRVALVTTHGFRDVIEIGRQNRSEVYNLFVERPRPLVAREDRLTVRERIDYRGNVLRAARGRVGRARLRASCARATSRRSRSACCTPTPTTRTSGASRTRSQRRSRACAITRSSEIDPEYREYERFSTTVVNAVLAPIVGALSRTARRRASREAASRRRST